MHDVGPVSATPALPAKPPAVWLPSLSHGRLLHPGSIKDRPKQLSDVSRSRTKPLWGGRGSNPRPTDYESAAPTN
jgi:hypothetical protein